MNMCCQNDSYSVIFKKPIPIQNVDSSFWVDYSAYIILFLSFLVPFIYRQIKQFNKRRTNKALLINILKINMPNIDTQIEGLKQSVEEIKDVDKDTYSVVQKEVNFAGAESILTTDNYSLIRNGRKHVLQDTFHFSNLKYSIRETTDLMKSLESKRNLISLLLNKSRSDLSNNWLEASEYYYKNIPPAIFLNRENEFGKRLSKLGEVNKKWALKLKEEQKSETPTWTRTSAYQYGQEMLKVAFENELLEPGAMEFILLLKRFIQSHEEYVLTHQTFSREYSYILRELEKNKKLMLEAIEYIEKNF